MQRKVTSGDISKVFRLLKIANWLQIDGKSLRKGQEAIFRVSFRDKARSAKNSSSGLRNTFLPPEYNIPGEPADSGNPRKYGIEIEQGPPPSQAFRRFFEYPLPIPVRVWVHAVPQVILYKKC